MISNTAPIQRITPRPEFAQILREPTEYSNPDSTDVGNRLNGWFDRAVVQSGLSISPPVLILLSLAGGLALGGGVFVIQEQPLTTAVSTLLGFLIPVCWVLVSRHRRQAAILGQLPGMIEELARAAKTGRSLEICLQRVTEDTPAPLGTELRRCRQKMNLGLRLDEALGDLSLRTGVTSIRIFTMALSVHQRTGGDLVQVLQRLSRTIHDRLTFLGRLRTATAGSRATAFLMLGLPPAILAFFLFRDPEYLANLWATSWGRGTVITAIVLELIGSVWILRILKRSQRT